jgi:curved DNA-binding protein CbpA
MAQPVQPKFPDAYSDLGLDPNASSTEIKAAYRKLALLHHPDKKVTTSGETTDAAEFRRANEAYELLKDDQAKARYDQRHAGIKADWAKYRVDVADFQKNPDAWRKKQAGAARPTSHSHSSAHHYYDASDYENSDFSDEHERDFKDFAYYFFASAFGYGHHDDPRRSNSGARRAQHDREWEEFLAQRERARHESYQQQREWEANERAARREKEANLQAAEKANKRAIDRQKEEADAQQAQTDGIRTLTPEQRLAMAKAWVEGLQRKYAEQLKSIGIKNVSSFDEGIDLGWDKKKGRHTCHFCDAVVQEYSFRCPSGGAVACRGCKNAIASSSLSRPFSFKNTYAGAKKGKSKKKAKKAKARTTQEVDPEEEEEEAEEEDFGKEAGKLAAELAREEEAQRLKKEELMRKIRKARQEAARETRENAERKAAEQAAREKAAAEMAAREKAATDEAAREAAELREARANELQEEKAQKKAARKKAAKERVALEKAKETAAKAEAERLQNEAREKEEREREAQEVREQELRERKDREDKEAREKAIRDQEAQQAREHAARLAREANERKAKELAKCAAREELMQAEQQARVAAEIAARAEQEVREQKPKATRPPLICHTCNEEGHIARKCPTKIAPNTNGAIPSPPHSALEPGHEPSAHGIKVQLPPRTHSSNITANLPAMKIVISPFPGPENMTIGQDLPSERGTEIKIKLPPLAPLHSAANARPRKKAPRCYTWKGEGHLSRNCPVKAEKGTVGKAEKGAVQWA